MFGNVRFQPWDARWPRVVMKETVITFLYEAFLPTPNTGLRLAGPSHDLNGANILPRQPTFGSPPYLTTIVVTHDHDTGIANREVYRTMVRDNSSVIVNLSSNRY